MANKKTVTEGSVIIDAAMDKWMEHGKGNIHTLCVRTARKLSKDPVFNLACWMKSSFVLSGESDSDWLETAKYAINLVSVK